MSAVETDPPAPATAPIPTGARGLLMPVLLAAGLSTTLASGAVFFITSRHAAPAADATAALPADPHGGGHETHAEAAAPAKKGAAQYLPLSPAFTVNLADPDGSHFLQVDMEVMTRDAAALEAIKQNLPQIRNALLMLLSQLKVHDVASREAKEALQKQVVDEIRKVLVAETGKPSVEAVFFTSFVVQ